MALDRGTPHVAHWIAFSRTTVIPARCCCLIARTVAYLILQVDGYAGYNRLTGRGRKGGTPLHRMCTLKPKQN